jgi:hypothetical protein
MQVSYPTSQLKYRKQAIKSSTQPTFSEAPPTRNPSRSGCAANSTQFPAFTEPAMHNRR